MSFYGRLFYVYFTHLVDTFQNVFHSRLLETEGREMEVMSMVHGSTLLLRRGELLDRRMSGGLYKVRRSLRSLVNHEWRRLVLIGVSITLMTSQIINSKTFKRHAEIFNQNRTCYMGYLAT